MKLKYFYYLPSSMRQYFQHFRNKFNSMWLPANSDYQNHKHWLLSVTVLNTLFE